MLRIIVGLSWFITVAFMWLPNSFKSQFMRDHERLIIKMMAIISLVLTLGYLYGQ